MPSTSDILLYIGGLIATLILALVVGIALAQGAPTHGRARRERLRAQGFDVLEEPVPAWRRRLDAARARRGPPPAA
jgi:cytochrome bd-type quinol oxidase subunit 2